MSPKPAIDEATRLRTMLQFEREVKAEGFQRIAGVDEAGRGPLAGPLVAGAVILAAPVAGLNDSKQLTENRREALFETLRAGDHAIGVGQVEADELDRIGLQAANYAAMLRAVAALDPAPEFLLVDGFAIPACPYPQKRLVKGDARSLSIAAASIVAKVTRDRIMQSLDAAYPAYGFGKHKGYGTKAHLEAIQRQGPSPVHRKSFAPIAQFTETGSLW